jgi:hypothetical protein
MYSSDNNNSGAAENRFMDIPFSSTVIPSPMALASKITSITILAFHTLAPA